MDLALAAPALDDKYVATSGRAYLTGIQATGSPTTGSPTTSDSGGEGS